MRRLTTIKFLRLIIVCLLCRFRTSLMKYGDKFTGKEVDDAYEHFYIDDKGFIDLDSLINMVTGGGDEEGEES